MTENLTMRELRNRFNDLIEQGYGDKIVEVTSETVSNHIPKTSLRQRDDDKCIDTTKYFRGHRMRKLGVW